MKTGLEKYIDNRIKSLKSGLLNPQGSIWQYTDEKEIKARLAELLNLIDYIEVN